MPKKNSTLATPAELKRTVDSPSHYTIGGIETWDFIEAKNLSYNLGTAVAYISRAPYKGNQIEDLYKGLKYIQREIKRLSQSGTKPAKRVVKSNQRK